MESLLTWLWQTSRPIGTINDLLDDQNSRSTQAKSDAFDFPIFRTWGSALTVAIAVQWIAFVLSGIEVSEQFLLLYQLVAIIIALSNVLVLYALLKLLRVTIDLQTTAICYTAVILFLPFSTLAGILPSSHFFSALNIVHSQHLGLLPSLSYYFCNGAKLGMAAPNSSVGMQISTWGGTVTLFAAGVCTAESIAQVSGTTRQKAYFAVSFTPFASSVIYIALIFLQAMIVVLAIK